MTPLRRRSSLLAVAGAAALNPAKAGRRVDAGSSTSVGGGTSTVAIVALVLGALGLAAGAAALVTARRR